MQDVQRAEPPRLLAQTPKNDLRRVSSAAMLKGSNGGRIEFGGGEGRAGLKVAASEQNLRRPKTSGAIAITPKGSLQSQTSSDRAELGFGAKKVDFNDWSVVKLMEQYDPEDMAVSQPFMYVADHMVRINLSVGIAEEMKNYEEKLKGEEALSVPKGGSPVTIVGGSNGVGGHAVKQANWFEKLRDGLEKEAEIGWYVVVCEDEERAPPSTSASDLSYGSGGTDPQKTPTRRGLRSFFSRKKDSREERLG